MMFGLLLRRVRAALRAVRRVRDVRLISFGER